MARLAVVDDAVIAVVERDLARRIAIRARKAGTIAPLLWCGKMKFLHQSGYLRGKMD
jgi:hypothetical protein